MRGVLPAMALVASTLVVGCGAGGDRTSPDAALPVDAAPLADVTASPDTAAPFDASGDAGLALDADAARDLAVWPFAVGSPWNVPLGGDAQYDSPEGGATENLRSSVNPTHVNWDQYSIPVYVAAAGDPTITLDWQSASVAPYANGTSTFQAPAGVAPSPGTDGDVLVISADHRTGNEAWQLDGGPTSFVASYYVKTDLRGDGWSGGIHAAGCSLAGGLIRASELRALHIPHAISLALDATQLALGPVWPATSQDGDATRSYSGQVHVGQLVAIPPEVDVDRLGLTPSGAALAHALQDYGAYVDDRSVGLTFYVEPAADERQVEDLRADAATLQSELVLVLNNGASSVGGGGTPRAAPAPPLP